MAGLSHGGLSHGDLVRVLSVIEAVGEARDPDEFSRVALEQVARVIPSDAVSINEVEPSAGRFVYLMYPPTYTIPPEVEQEWLPLADQHPLIQHLVATGDGSARRISDVMSQDEFHTTPFYGPIGVEYQMSVNLPAPRPVVVAIVASRGECDFSDRDRQVLNVLRPHLIQTWYNAREQRRFRSLLSAARDATADFGGELVVLSDPLHEVTPGALVTLYRAFGRPSATSPLPARVARWVAAQQARLDNPDTIELQKPLRVDHDGHRVVLHYLPAQRDHPGALLLRADAPAPRGPTLEALGLTPREAEIVQCLIGGATNADVGRALHVSPGTVKKHLDNIYTKLGVRGRGRLTAFVVDVLERQNER